jgi:hypothetical protein
MAGHSFDIQTWDGSSPPLGLSFSEQMLTGGQATLLEPSRSERGTTLVIYVRNKQTFNLLLEKLQHWCRDVEGFSAQLQPSNQPLPQGNVNRPPAAEGLAKANWIERAHLSPVAGPNAWTGMSGNSTVAILYRGVFVQEFTANKIWGIQGSIDVDPKYFQPRLNREGFVEGEFRATVEGYLKQTHPAILLAMAGHLSHEFQAGHLDQWSQKQWATLWLSIPRDATYASVARRWDEIFRQVPAFELAVGDAWRPMSLDQLLALTGDVYVAPHKDEKVDDVIKSAIRLLRHTRRHVIRGLQRERSWMRDAQNYFTTTADLIAQVFGKGLPPFIRVAQQAEQILNDVPRLAVLYGGSPLVELVRNGADTPPVLRLSTRLVVNLDHPVGPLIVEEVLAQNTGRWALIESVARHAHEHLSSVAAALRDAPMGGEEFGLVKRRYIRGLLS